MLIRIFLVVLLTSPVVLAKPSPTTRHSKATTQATTNQFPSPNELFAKMKNAKAEKDKLPKVAYFDLAEPIAEKPQDFTFFASSRNVTLHSLIDRLHQAKDDKEIKAVLVSLGDTSFNLAQAQEIRDALAAISKAGKPTYVYADAYDTAPYIAATGATDICLLQGGEMMLPGVGIETTFARGTLDKLGVKADYIQIGEFKGADEEYTRTEASPELKGELNKLVDSLYNQLVQSISDRRNLSPDAVKEIFDVAMLTADQAKDRGLVDHLVDPDSLRELIGKKLGEKVELVKDYGEDAQDEPDLSNPFSFFTMMMKKPEEPEGPCVALIYAEGVIVDGAGGDSMFSESGVGSDDIRKAVRIALKDENIKAIVIRIDSPGGSALASEAMWQSVRHLAKEKPVIISVGSMAASGGYYLASAGDTIYADPTAIIGSIGVVGGKFVIKDLYNKIGLNSESFTRGKNADLYSSSKPFSDSQREMVTNWMKDTYKMFTQRVMSTRKDKIKDIDLVARGRIFVAANAKELGLVDEIGGIEAAIEQAAKRADLEEGDYDVRSIPGPKSFADFISGGSESRSPIRSLKLNISADSILRVLAPSARNVLVQQLQMIQLLQQRPVILAAPYVVTTK